METEVRPVKIVAPGEGLEIQSASERGHVKLFASDTVGQLQLVEFPVEPGFGPPYHIHHMEDEIFYVVEGEVEFTLDGKKTIAGAGSTVFAPRGVPHRFQGAGEKTPKFVIFITGDNFEKFYGRWAALQTSGNFTMEAGAALAAEHGIYFLDQP